MANVAAQSAEDFGDRVIYRYPSCRFEQTPGNISLALSKGLKTLTNTAGSTSFIIPASGLPARMYKVEWVFTTSVQVNEFARPVGNVLIQCDFNEIYIPTLNYDGKALQTRFYKKNSEVYFSSNQLRAINIVDLQFEPLWPFSSLQFQVGAASSYLQFNDALVGLQAIMQPVVTFFKK